MLLALVMTVMTASAWEAPTYALSVGENEHGTLKFIVNEQEVTAAAEGDKVTVVITFADGWSGEPYGRWTAAVASSRNRASDINMLKDFELKPVQGKDNQWTFTMKRANAEISVSYKKVIQAVWVQDIDAVTYSYTGNSYHGNAQEPAVVVKEGQTTLTEGVDYTVRYANNVNAAASTAAAAPTAIITGIGNYTGEVQKTFTIEKAQGEVTFSSSKFTKMYDDLDFTITPTVIGNGTLTYSSDDETVATVNSVTGNVSIKGSGKATITASLSSSSNFAGTSGSYELTVASGSVAYEDGEVLQGEDGYIVNLTEDTGNPNPDPLPDGDALAELTYSRTLTAPGTEEGSGDIEIDDTPANLFTVCLPFKPETGEAARYYTLSGVTGETLFFDEVTSPVSHTPYLVAVTGSSNFTESCEGLEIGSTTISSTTVDGYTFNGTFTGMTNADAQGRYILQAGNKWGRVTAENSGAFIPPFRAFIEGPTSGARLLSGSIHGGDGNATGIKYIRTQDIDGTERYFDLNGRRIEKPATKGIYIHNGRKEVLK